MGRATPLWSKRFVVPTLIGALAVLSTVLIMLPARWFAPLVERTTASHIVLANVHGSIWHGGGVLVLQAPLAKTAPAVAVAQVSWQVHAATLLAGRIDASLDITTATSSHVTVTGDWYGWHVGPAKIVLAGDSLAALGAPFNTLGLTGAVIVAWDSLDYSRSRVTGNAVIMIENTSSRLSPVQPLGTYRIDVHALDDRYAFELSTASGALSLEGHGTVSDAGLSYTGTARASEKSREALADLLSVIGERDGDVTRMHFGQPDGTTVNPKTMLAPPSL
jgi:general secretion pathway protein N